MKPIVVTDISPPPGKAGPSNVVGLAGANPPKPTRPRFQRRHVWLVAIAAAALLAVVGIAIDVRRRAPLRAPPLLVIAPVTQGLVVGAVRTTGTVVPAQSTVISQPVPGRLLRVNAQPGQRVVRGQILARFDPLALRAEYARAESQLVSAEVASLEAEIALFRLGRELPEGGEESLPDQPVDLIRADVAAARAARAAAEVTAREAAFRVARQRLAQGVVRAPADGVILARNVEEGQVVEAGAPLFSLAGASTSLRLQASVAEADSAAIAIGQQVKFSVPAYPGRAFSGRVETILPFAGPETARRLPIVVSIAEPRDPLQPGMTAAGKIRTSSDRSAVRVPTAALIFAPRHLAVDREEPAVWVTEPGGTELRQVPVQIGIMDGAFAEVRGEGLREGAGVAVGYAATR